ncbi:MAG: hypothetical protein JXA21_19340 [Anaerolineae bacterium]|nr:hypothetical protein [Anaerolineae bacterium]
MKKTKQNYQRTAALLGAQPRTRATQQTRQTASSRAVTRALPRVSWKILLPLVLAAVVTGWLFVDSRWYLMGENLQVLGASSIELAREAALTSDLLGWHGMFLRPRDAQERVLQDVAGVTSAEVTCHRYPAACVIAITERTPVLVWQNDTATYCADKEGVLFPAPADRAKLPAGLTMVRGPLPGTEEDGIGQEIFQGIEGLAKLGVPVDVLEYHPQRGLIWVDPEGRRVAFGVGPDMALRWQVYTALIAHLDAKGIFPWSVDVQFANGATYSMDRAW